MKKRFKLGLIVCLMLVICLSIINAQTDSMSELSKASSGVNINEGQFGGTTVTVNTPLDVIAYRDSSGAIHTVTGLNAGGTLELDSNGKLIRANFVPVKDTELIFSGDIKATIPANSKIVGTDGKNFDITFTGGSKLEKDPVSLNPKNSKGDSLLNFKIEKNPAKFSEFELQGGVISHNGKNFLLQGGNNAVVSGVSLSSSVKEGNKDVFFDHTKVPENSKTGYTLIDLKEGYVKSVGSDGKIDSINFIEGNSIANLHETNRFGYQSGNNGQVSVQNQNGKIYSYVQGNFAMYNGQLYLYTQGRGLIGFFNRLFGTYSAIPVSMSFYTQDGNILLTDRRGNALGLYITPKDNGLTQITTGPAPNNGIVNPAIPNPGKPASPSPEMPIWQHNPDNPPLPGPELTETGTNPGTKPNPAEQNPESKYPFTKQEFLKDIYSTQTKFPARMIGSDFGQVLQTVNPELFKKHFGPGSTTTIDQAMTEYKQYMNSMAQKFGQDPQKFAKTFQQKYPDLYNKYAKYLGFG